MTKFFDLYLIGNNAIKFVKSSKFLIFKKAVHVIPIDEFFNSLKELLFDPNSLVNFDYQRFGKFILKIQKLNDGVISTNNYVLYVDDRLLVNSKFIFGIENFSDFLDFECKKLPSNITTNNVNNNYKKLLVLYSAKTLEIYSKTGAIYIEDAPCTVDEFIRFFGSEKKSILKKYYKDYLKMKHFSYGSGLFAVSLINLFIFDIDKTVLYATNLYAFILLLFIVWAENIRDRRVKYEKQILYDDMIKSIKEKYFLMPDDSEEVYKLTKK